MSNVLHTAFYLARPREQACLGNSRDKSFGSAGRNRLRRRCGTALRQRGAAKASASLVAEWQPPSLAVHYATGSMLSANVSSATAQPAPLLRPAQSAVDRAVTTTRQQS